MYNIIFYQILRLFEFLKKFSFPFNTDLMGLDIGFICVDLTVYYRNIFIDEFNQAGNAWIVYIQLPDNDSLMHLQKINFLRLQAKLLDRSIMPRMVLHLQK